MERLLNNRRLFWLLLVGVYVLCLFTCIAAKAQTYMPAFMNPDPAYWYQEFENEQARANGLEQSGKTAISGLQASLKAANDTISAQQVRLVQWSDEIGVQSAAAINCQESVQPITDERDKLKGKTVAGQFLRKVRNKVLAPVGGAAILLGILKIVL